MRMTTVLCTCSMLVVPVYAFSAQQEGQTVPLVQKPAGISPIKAKPAQKPKTTSSRDKVSVTGYGEDPGEETQERPNPLNKQGLTRPDPGRPPVR